MCRNMSEADEAEVWQRYADGASAATIAMAMGFRATSVAELIRRSVGIRPTPRSASPSQLSLEDRKKISRGLAAGESIPDVARAAQLGSRIPRRARTPPSAPSCPKRSAAGVQPETLGIPATARSIS